MKERTKNSSKQARPWKSFTTSQKESEYTVSQQQPAWKPKFPLFPLPQLCLLLTSCPRPIYQGKGRVGRKEKPWHCLIKIRKPQELSCCEKSSIHPRQTQFTVTIKVTSNWEIFSESIKVITTSGNLNISGTAITSPKQQIWILMEWECGMEFQTTFIRL